MSRRKEVEKMLLRHAPTVWNRLSTWRDHAGTKISPDIYLKVFQLDTDLVRHSVRGLDYLILDEAQDLNPVMRAFAETTRLRILAVGDPWQQIYSWRGAEDALEMLPGKLLYLSQSFRFGEAIAAVARRLLASKPDAAPTVPIRCCKRQSVVVEGDSAPVVLCRTNAGCLAGAIATAKGGLRPHVLGGIADLADELREAQALYEGRQDQLPESSPFRRFRDWAELKAEARAVGDTSLERLAKAVEDGIVRDLVVLERMHSAAEERADRIFGTTHKAKGREWHSVALATDFPDWERLRKRFKAAEANGSVKAIKAALEEWHVLYVAVTRAVDRLVLPSHLYEWLVPYRPV